MAKFDKYEVEISDSTSQYVFYSIGNRGKIEKRVQYTELNASTNTDNCAFGDWDTENECIDDSSVTNNGDRDKVLATVVGTIYDYTNIHPDRYIYFKGSNLVRTQMYGKIISDYYDELIEEFYIFGIKCVTVEGIDSDEPFIYSKDERHQYMGFVVKRR